MMNTDVVADTSAIIAVILREPARRAIIKSTIGVSVISPVPVYWEVGIALLKGLRKGSIDARELKQAMEVLGNLAVRFVEVDVVSSLLIAHRLNLTCFDGYVLQCAMDWKLPLLTLDQTMRAAALESGTPVVDLR